MRRTWSACFPTRTRSGLGRVGRTSDCRFDTPSRDQGHGQLWRLTAAPYSFLPTAASCWPFRVITARVNSSSLAISAAPAARFNADDAKVMEVAHAANARVKVAPPAGNVGATRRGPAANAAAPGAIPPGSALDAKVQESSDVGSVTAKVNLTVPDAKATAGCTASPATAPDFLDAIRAMELASGIAGRARAWEFVSLTGRRRLPC